MKMSENDEVIKVEGLTKVYNHSLTAVDHIDFSVKRGEIFGFLGPNGAGKTTTISMLITVTKPTEGTARHSGRRHCKTKHGRTKRNWRCSSRVYRRRRLDRY